MLNASKARHKKPKPILKSSNVQCKDRRSTRTRLGAEYEYLYKALWALTNWLTNWLRDFDFQIIVELESNNHGRSLCRDGCFENTRDISRYSLLYGREFYYVFFFSTLIQKVHCEFLCLLFVTCNNKFIVYNWLYFGDCLYV